MRRASKAGTVSLLWLAAASAMADAPTCKGTLYLTLDTGTMGPAEAMAAVLKRQGVKATFFLANEPAERGGSALDASWGDYWKARVAEGHAFGSHTWRHWYFRGDRADRTHYVAWGAKQGEWLDATGVCAELKKSEDAFRSLTGRGFDGLWRAPGGNLTPNATRFAEQCGYRHVGWSPAGFSGDELPSERFPSRDLIATQLRDLRDGDILLWHLGIRSRKDPLYPHLETLIAGLKEKGFCFATMTQHPAFAPRR